MRPLPNLSDEAAMLRRGRESALWAARKDALETLRDALTACNASGMDDLSGPAHEAADAAQRLIEISTAWGTL